MDTISKKNKILFCIAIAIFTISCSVLLYAYKSMPPQIVVHSYNGSNDAYGDKSYLWVMVAINAVLLLVIGTAIAYCKKWYRPTPEMKFEDRDQSIDTARMILAIVAIKVSVLFSIILFN